MKKFNFTFIVALLLVIVITELRAQDASLASGGNASGSGGSGSYSVGQTVYSTYNGSNGAVTQGVQQPFEIQVISEINEITGINLTISAFPNPTKDLLTLRVDASTSPTIELLSYQLYDLQGKLLETKKLEANQTGIAMSNLVSATYFLKVIQSNKEIKTFKIIKN